MDRRETWYTADLHIGHRLIADKRGFPTPESHDTELAHRWDTTIGAEDTVWVLGDISAGGRTGQANALHWIADRPGTKHLISGNHDSVHPMHPDAHKHMPAYLKVFATVQQAAHRTIAGQPILLSHLPYLDSDDPDDTHARFDQWRLPNMGAWLLHGHLHTTRKTSGTRSLHVGLDAWELTPVSINAIAGIINRPETVTT
jgi:calcineurin-like phosphoesterase family protein